VVNLLITELAVFKVGRPGLSLIELSPGTTVEEIAERTGAPFSVALSP
jgi:3-oxoacid CoA-transferase subunit B